MIKNIIFDFGGVILKHKGDIMEQIIAKIFPASLEEASQIWDESKAELITGEKDSKKFLKELKNKYKTRLTSHELFDLWKKLYKKEAEEVDWELLKFIEKLRTKYNVYLFTDTIDVHDRFNSTRNIYESFNRVFKSFEEGTIKTEKEAFVNVLKKIKAKPEECIFIDDFESNVKIAKSLKMRGIVFFNPKQLKKELASNKIIWAG
jgi:epoxide hydrolase-like predicted phosphatase